MGDLQDNTTTTLPRLITTVEVARLLRVSPRTLQRWRWTGSGPPYLKIGARVRYTRPAIEAYVRAAERRPGASQVGGRSTPSPAGSPGPWPGTSKTGLGGKPCSRGATGASVSDFCLPTADGVQGA